MAEKNSSRSISVLNKKINHLRAWLYISVAILVLLTCIGVYWINLIYDKSDEVAEYYSSPTIPPKASLYLSPQSGNYKVGAEFNIEVLLNTKGNSVNAVAAYLSYNKNKLEAVSIDVSDSLFNITMEKNIDQADGKIKIGLARPTPGIKAFGGMVAKIHFKALAKTTNPAENIYFDFTNDSDLYSGVFLNDKKGTNVLDAVRGAKIIIE